MRLNKIAVLPLGTAVLLLVSLGCQRNDPAPKQDASAEHAVSPDSMTLACNDCVPVTPDNFVRAETDLYFSNFVKEGGLAKFTHNRTPTPITQQTVVRMNRDTLYSSAVFDLDAGPVTITLPDAGIRFMSMQVINEDQYTPMVVYGKGSYTLTKDKVETRYVAALVRTLADPNSDQDLDEVHKLQDAIKSEQKNSGSFEIPKWDKSSQDKVREGLMTLASTIHEFHKAFGTRQQVDPVTFLIGAAAGWGGNPDKEAKYVNLNVPNPDGKQVYKLTVKDVPVDGFWSISVYNAKGYFEANPSNAYSLNNITAQKSGDGSVAVQFGGCNDKTTNCLPIMPGWNAIIRLYRPRPEILSGKWKFPDPQPV